MTADEPSSVPGAAPVVAFGSTRDVVPLRHLLGAAFDLLVHAGDELRAASFYVGAVTLGTAGPLALASFAIGVVGPERSPDEVQALAAGSLGVVLAFLAVLAVLGIVVVSVESRILAVAVLGGRMSERRISTRAALARARRTFWRTVVASVIVAVPVGAAQQFASAVIDPLFGAAVEASVLTTTVVTALVGAPFAYVLSGVVLGDVDPFEAIRRSFRVFSARRLAAVLVVTFEAISLLLMFAGATSGLDLALRVLETLGLGFDAGPAGLALMTLGIVTAVFAFGTLLATVVAITVAPQVVMFVGLTHATMGLDHVVPGGRDDPDAGRRTLRTFPLPMLAGVAAGVLLLGLVVLTIAELGT